MKLGRPILFCITAAFVLMMSAGCAEKSESSKPAEKTHVNVVAIKGPTGVGMVNLMKSNKEQSTGNIYNFTTVSSPDLIVAKISNKEADIAAAPTNLAASLYNKTGGKVQMLGINTKGVLYIMENGNTVNSIADLKGKTVYTTGKGANPEFLLRYLLTENGIDPDKDVNIEFKSENDELAALLVTESAKIALVPEPVVSTVKTKNSKLRVALDMTAEWSNISEGQSELLMGCIIGRKEFIEQNPQAVTVFLEEYKASVEKALSDIDSTAQLCEEYEIIPKAAIAKAAIPGCSLTYIDSNDMMDKIKGYFDVLFAANPQSVGGALPDDEFYYNIK